MSLAPPWLLERATRTPERVALVTPDRSLTFAELARRAGHAARALREHDIGTGDVVALHARAGVHYAELLHATSLLGATLLPLNIRLAQPEQDFQLRDAGAKLLVHDAELPAELARGAHAAGLPVLALDPASPIALPAASPVRVKVAPQTALAVVYTSGTTGTPKGAELSHAGFFWSAVAHAFHLGTRPGDRWLACLPLFHVGGLAMLVRNVLHGNALVVHDRFDADAVNHSLDRDGISHVSLVPTMLERLLGARGNRPAPPGLRCVLLGGGPAPVSLLERAWKLGFPLAPTYGLTEATSQVATRPPLASAPVEGGLQPLPGITLRIEREDGSRARLGEAGEILVAGPTLMRGYRGRPLETADTLRHGWLHTGDVGELAEDGSLRVLDRRSDLIVSGGENVYPGEIEAALEAHPEVAEAGVTGVSDPDFGRRPAAWVVPRPGCNPTSEALQRWCRERLAGYKVPVEIQRTAALPRNATGKLQRARLAATACSGRPAPRPRRPRPGSGG